MSRCIDDFYWIKVSENCSVLRVWNLKWQSVCGSVWWNCCDIDLRAHTLCIVITVCYCRVLLIVASQINTFLYSTSSVVDGVLLAPKCCMLSSLETVYLWICCVRRPLLLSCDWNAGRECLEIVDGMSNENLYHLHHLLFTIYFLHSFLFMDRSQGIVLPLQCWEKNFSRWPISWWMQGVFGLLVLRNVWMKWSV